MTRLGGFSLVEVLVALLVLSLGVLGMAGLQLKSLQGAQVAKQRSQATLAAEDFGERLWFWVGQQSGLACPDDAAIDERYRAWLDDWTRELPDLANRSGWSWADKAACNISLEVRWQDERFVTVRRNAEGEQERIQEEVASLDYVIGMPSGG
ncbi:type IV pilus modification protein PilV [Halomonas sp. 1390]|uniref:type IV pilus modification protein PilV n=1 Tax=Halomonas sp. B23F22_3 TaxID=3459516 RepID=UPI00373E893F